MSKVEIDANLGQGLYRVRLKYAMGQVNAEIERIGARIAVLAVKIPDQKTLVLQKGVDVSDIVRDINLLIPSYQSGDEGAADEIRDAQIKLARVQNEYTLLSYDLEMLITENLSISRRRNQLEQIPEERVMDAWCADYTLDLEGLAGAIDVNDEGRQGVIIRPGYADDAVWNAGRDGELMAREAQSGGQAFFNAAILPGVQKWRPRYRTGEISNIISDYCTVNLDMATSSAQGLPINQTDTLTDVPILYMDCNGQAFIDGDKVLVRFTQNGPLVVGFEKEPVDCLAVGFIFAPALTGQTTFDTLTTWGTPFDDSEGLINPPLGTEGSAEPVWTGARSAGQYSFLKGYDYTYGMRNWIGPAGLALSWHGPSSRVTNIGADRGGGSTLPTYGTAVFNSNKVFVDMSVYGLPHDNVEGAAITQTDPSRLIVVVSNSPSSSLTFSENVVVSAYEFTLIEGAPSGDPRLIDSFTSSDAYMKIASGMYFNRSGTAAVMTLHGTLDSSPYWRGNPARAAIRFNGSSFIYGFEVFDPPGTYTRDYGNDFSHPYDDDSGVSNPTKWGDGSSFDFEEYYYPEARQLIYLDYIGDDEVRAELLYPEFTKRRSRSTSLSTETYTWTDENDRLITSVRPTGWSESIEKTSTMGPMQIMANGRALATIGTGVNESDIVNYSHGGGLTWTGYGSYTFSDTVAETREYIDTNTLFLDARTGAIFFTTKSTSRTSSGSSSGSDIPPPGVVDKYYYFNNAYFDGRYIQASSTYSASTIRDTLEETSTDRSTPNKGVDRALNIIDWRQNTRGVWDLSLSSGVGHLFDDMVRVPITQNDNSMEVSWRTLWYASSAGTSRSAVTSFVYYNPTQVTAKAINHFDTVINPISTIMDRTDGVYFFLNVSVA